MNQIVVVTGASSGMGLATSLLLAESGYTVYGGVRSQEAARAIEAAAQQRKVSIKPLQLDVQRAGQVDDAIASVVEREGQLDALVNNAGYGLIASVEDGTDDEFIRQFDVNVFGVLRVCRAAIPYMRARHAGTIVNIGSFLGQIGLPLLAHYNASKYAVEGITDSLRMELQPFGVRVHTVAPGLFRTNFASKGLAANSRTTAPDSPYAVIANRFLPEVSRRIVEGPDPVAVAHAVLSVLRNPDSPARLPIGSEAVRSEQILRTMTPEEAEATLSKAFGLS